MAKTVAEYLSAERTANQEAFLNWVITTTGVTFKSAAERAAFDKGVRCAGLYSRFQSSKRETPAPAAPVVATPAKAAAKRSATKASA